MHFVYVLKSKKDGKLYISCSGDLGKRLREHAEGKVRSTAFRRPLELVYSETFDSVYDAFRRERFYKTAVGKRIVKKLIANCGIG